MKSPLRWQRCIAHHDDEAAEFLAGYFGRADRACLLVAGAGFDPRSAIVARLLAKSAANGTAGRLRGLFIRERRPNPDPGLATRGDESTADLLRLVPGARAVDVDVLSPEDKAVIGGHRAVQVLRDGAAADLASVTDVVLDMSALSIGISFPLASFLYETSRRAAPRLNFHILVASHPQLDAAISSGPSDVVDPIRGFSGDIDLAESDDDPKIWLPHLATGRNFELQLIKEKLQGPVDVCPVLPLSQQDPRAGDALTAAFETELDRGWEVDPRNIVYAIEDDPLDLYRTISSIHRRHTEVFSGVARGHVVLSPSGNKVLAIGALMAAMEHGLPVRYVEAVSYAVDWDAVARADPATSRLVHVWLHGDPYAEPAASATAGAGA